MTRKNLSVVLALLLAACGGDEEQSGSSSMDMSDVGGDMSMTRPDMSMATADMTSGEVPRQSRVLWEGDLLDTAWGRLDANDPDGPLALIRQEKALLVVSLYRDVELGVNAVAEASLATNPEGLACVAWVADDQVQYGCTPDFVVRASSPVDGSGYQLSMTKEDATLWYQQGASAHSLVHDNTVGPVFSETELYESSISYFTDASSARVTVSDGTGLDVTSDVPVGCLISSSDRAELYGVSESASPTVVTDCKFSSGGARLAMLASSTTQASVGYSYPSDRGFGYDMVYWTVPMEGAMSVASVEDDFIILQKKSDQLRAVKISGLKPPAFPGAMNTDVVVTESKLDAWKTLSNIRKGALFTHGSRLSAFVQGERDGATGIHYVEVERDMVEFVPFQ